MICRNCKVENQDENFFCKNCGTKLSNRQAEFSHQKQIKSRKKLILITMAVLLCSLVLFFYFSNPIRNYANEVDEYKYDNAKEIYNQEIKGKAEKEKKIKAYLLDKVDEVENLYIIKKITYSKAKETLIFIKNTDLVNDEATKTIEKIDKINSSRIAYKKAIEFQNQGDIKEAIKEYKNVIKDDENYEDAQKQIQSTTEIFKKTALEQAEENANFQDFNKAVSLLKEASLLISDDSEIVAKLVVYEKKLEEKNLADRKYEAEKARNEQLVSVESSMIIEQSSDYKSLYPDMIQVLFKNNSEKTIKSMKVGSLGYDNNGYPIKVKTEFAFSGGNYEFVGTAEDVNIVPGAMFGDGRGWHLDSQHGISQVLSCVKEVTFYDGTKWINPYYQFWIEEYKEKPLN